MILIFIMIKIMIMILIILCALGSFLNFWQPVEISALIIIKAFSIY